MTLVIEDEVLSDLVARLARERGLSPEAAVRLAVESALAREASFQEKLERFWAENPMPEPTGLKADKAFYDEMSGEV